MPLRPPNFRAFEGLRLTGVALVDGNVTIKGRFGLSGEPQWMPVTVTIGARDGAAEVQAYKSAFIGNGATGLHATSKLGVNATRIAVRKALGALDAGVFDSSPELAKALKQASR